MISPHIALREDSSVQTMLALTAVIAKILLAFLLGCLFHFSMTLSQNSRISFFVNTSLSGSNAVFFTIHSIEGHTKLEFSEFYIYKFSEKKESNDKALIRHKHNMKFT